jgi:anhydro-N-acetylmuramic acid kinase
MIVAGIMSGTSADGIDVALTQILGRGPRLRIQLLHHRQFPYPSAVRRAVLAMMNAGSAKIGVTVADLARLNFLLGELYAEAIQKTRKSAPARVARIELVGCHGQTLYHQGAPARFLGKNISVTWQTGEAAIIAARAGVPVVSDFRPADIAVGGLGAPLVPFLDYVFFRSPRIGRILQNLGGIANLTAIPAGASPEEVIAFDTGPGNMVIDAVTEQLFYQPFDRDGRIASQGKILPDVVAKCLKQPFFHQPPPRTAGREQFGREFVRDFIHHCKQSSQHKINKQDIVATATALTAASIAESLQRYVLPRSRVSPKSKARYQEFIVSGGGARNQTLMRQLNDVAKKAGLRLRDSEDFGMPSSAKEAVAFALLAYLTWHRLPGNIPSATGARRPAILGKICLP